MMFASNPGPFFKEIVEIVRNASGGDYIRTGREEVQRFKVLERVLIGVNKKTLLLHFSPAGNETQGSLLISGTPRTQDAFIVLRLEEHLA